MSRLRNYAPMKRQSEKKSAEVARDVTVHRWVRMRSGGSCEVTLNYERCRKLARDQHHVQKASQGGLTTAENLIDICRDHHDRTDWPWNRGRLVIVAHGDETFTSAVRYAPDKFQARGQG